MCKITSLLLVTFLFAALLSACNAQQKKSEETLDSFINKKAGDLYEKEKVPGIFIGLLNNGQRKYYSFGFPDPERKRQFDSTTLFEIGSISKTFTAYVLQSVLKEKNISDSSSILQYLPDSVQQNKSLQGISFLSLMNHTSGLQRLPENMKVDPADMAPYDNYTHNHLFAYLKTCTPKPNGKSNYSNLGAGLGGVLATKIAGENYEELVNKYIFTKFGIAFHPDTTIPTISNKAQGYFDKVKTGYWFADVLAPAGGLKCSAAEMLSYLETMAVPQTEAQKNIINTLLLPTIKLNANVNVCRAWHTIEEKDKPAIYWHNGGTYGFSAFGGFIKDKSKAVIIVVNQFNKNQVSDGLGISIMKKLLE